MSRWEGRFDMSQIDTNPGASGPFAPPTGGDGDSDAYRELIRGRYRNDLAARQQIGVVAVRLGSLHHRSVSFTGHWAIEARAIVETLAEGARQRRRKAA